MDPVSGRNTTGREFVRTQSLDRNFDEKLAPARTDIQYREDSSLNVDRSVNSEKCSVMDLYLQAQTSLDRAYEQNRRYLADIGRNNEALDTTESRIPVLNCLYQNAQNSIKQLNKLTRSIVSLQQLEQQIDHWM